MKFTGTSSDRAAFDKHSVFDQVPNAFHLAAQGWRVAAFWWDAAQNMLGPVYGRL